jgi:hypothetical protein
LPTNNLKENPNGESYRDRISATGSSDLLGWAGSVLAPRVQSVFDEFSAKYGWETQAKSSSVAESVDELEDGRYRMAKFKHQNAQFARSKVPHE